MSHSVERGKFLRDVRLGLVLYGGVSLAIYINGTANELFRAVRGRGVYFLLKHLLDADITVDVASGASAGGINGIFLAMALANDREFGTCADLWRRDGALDSLLRRLDDNVQNSVLDSEHYLDILENGFRQMWDSQLSTSEPEEPTETRELDLFIAGTDFYGQFDHTVDSSGRVIDIKQHGKVFLLKHRLRNVSKCQLDPRRDADGRWPDASPVEPSGKVHDDRFLDQPKVPPSADVGLLAFAKLAQITSCFPGAFSPVRVLAADRPDISNVDQRLRVWGRLDNTEKYFVDGGVLDNKPFTTTLDTIFHRPAHRRVCRHLLYLEPDPEQFSARKAPLHAPTFLATVTNSIAGIPRYESIASDLARVTAHNATVERFNDLAQALVDSNAPHEPLKRPYETARLLGLAQRIQEKLAESLSRPVNEHELETFLKDLHRAILAVPGGGSLDWLDRIDVDYHIRRVFAFTYALQDKLEGLDAKRAEPYSALWQNVNNELERLEIVRWALDGAIMPKSIKVDGSSHRTIPAGDIWDEIRRRAVMFLDAEKVKEWMPREPHYVGVGEGGMSAEARMVELSRKDYRREQFREDIKKRATSVASLDRNDVAPYAEPTQTVLEVSEARLKHIIEKSKCQDLDYEAFNARFKMEDALRYPLELASGVHQRDRISVFRFSPVDAKAGLSNRDFDKKICGETLGHFSAFLKRSWRSNDILWGRLDGICRLVEVLMLHTKFATSKDRPSELPKLDFDKLLTALGNSPEEQRAKLGRLFSHLDERLRVKPDDRDPLLELLGKLLKRPHDPAGRDELVRLLIEVAQLDALCEDLPKVIADAAQEQLEWQELKVGGELATQLDLDDRKEPQQTAASHGASGDAGVEPAPPQGPVPVGDDTQQKKQEAEAKSAEEHAKEARTKARNAYRNAVKADAAAVRARKRASALTAKAEQPPLAFNAEVWQFKAVGATLNASLISLATAMFAKEALGAMSVGGLKKYFERDYAVGGESAATAIPATSLVDLGARAVVLTERALLDSGKVGHSVRDHQLYRLIVRWPIRVIAAFAAFARRSPESRATLVLVFLGYALLAVVANVLYGEGLYSDDGLKRTIAIWAFQVLPFTAFVIACAFWRLQRRKPIPAGWLWTLLVAALVAGVALFAGRDLSTVIVAALVVGVALLAGRRIWMLTVAALVAGLAFVFIQLNRRPSLESYSSIAPLPVGAESPVQVRFGGVSTLVFDDGETVWMTDGFFSRPALARVAAWCIEPDQKAIKHGLDELRVTKLAAVVPLHSHYDHAMDAPSVAILTEAQLIGSESTLNLGRSAGMGEERLLRVHHGQTIALGEWRLTFIESAHEPQPWYLAAAGTIDEDFEAPAHASAWRVGDVWALVVKHDRSGRSWLVVGSAGYELGQLSQQRVDTVFAGVAGLAGQSRVYREQWWDETVHKVGARQVIPIHWDDFSLPLEASLQPLPYLFDEVGETLEQLSSFARRDGVELSLPPLFKPFVPAGKCDRCAP